MRIASVVLNNFTNDNRVYKVAKTLQGLGHEVTIVALRKGNVQEREIFNGIPVHRLELRSMRLPDNNKIYGALKFAEFFIKVIRGYRKHDIIHCNDFIGFVAGVLVKMTRPPIRLVYDSHEYQTEKYGVGRWEKKMMRWFERTFISRAKVFITVSKSIGAEYTRLYEVKVPVLVMNAPHMIQNIHSTAKLKDVLRLDPDDRLFLYQGGFAPSRGIEVLLKTFSTIPLEKCHIVFMGSGPLEGLIKAHVEAHSNIHYHAPVAYDELVGYSSTADYGIVSTQNLCLNNYYCMPNKLFEYIQSELPILSNNLKDCGELVVKEEIGVMVKQYDPPGVVEAMLSLMSKDRDVMLRNLRRCKMIYNWENEEKKLIAAYMTIMP